ncbi:MAG: outer membrane lipoprotein carrier protein LolA, partial [Myxococcales bacterium]|nr:outer membrane lipoprotein carrier protein LolA [Myxococcales bacterium]
MRLALAPLLLLAPAAFAQPAGAPTPKAPASAPASQAAAPVSPELAAVIDGIQAFYGTAQDLKADFEQTYTYKVYGRKQRSTGKVFFKKKGKMRWDYQAPEPKVFVADGDTLWVYEPEQSQVFKRGLKQAQLPVALSFMSGEGKLTDEFDATLLPDPAPGRKLIELVPKRDAGEYRALRLEVDAATHAVQASTVIDPVGNTNHL